MVPGEYLHDEQDDEEYSFIVFVVSVVSYLVLYLVLYLVSKLNYYGIYRMICRMFVT
jgi:hypothetical protein